ncbi:NAD(+) synthase [Lacihabitans sp. LS3-19]|uniref:NAD(+) synthase n=1 Tax=Lacihabitans sp. LS3-19 TaxID=2487335 RepID=UPI0020CC5E81|nr:NAD(+) synthase [Lacihabitans sp. LS3-19]MCP9766755.1 NAD(+) synthase [Lacihabitans sp. LS3-19]
MELVKVGAAALNQTPLDWLGNKKNILAAIEEAKSQNIQILCLPELCITSYGCEDAFYSPDVFKISLEILEDIVDNTQDIVTCVGLPIWVNNKIYNAACVIANRQILGFVCKQHLPNYGLFYEDRWFHRWKPSQISEISIKGIKYPVGDLIFNFENIRIGLEICEDGWVANRPAIRHFDKGVDIILNPSASPFAFHKFKIREQLVTDASRAFCCAYVYTNLLGNEAGRLIFDGDAMVCSGGDVLASSQRFSYADFTLTSAIVDIGKNKIEQAKIKSSLPTDLKLINSNFELTYSEIPNTSFAEMEAFEKGGSLKEEEFSRAVSLALFDYLRKSRSNGFTISLSGGADSCACTALCGLMVRLGDESIGFEQFKEKLSYIPEIKSAKSIKELTEKLILTIYQGTENSSADTLESAQKLAESIGAQFYNININGLVENYTSLIEQQIGRKLTWATDDIPLQNIQARVRAPGVWMLANLNNHLLLATSNRSEVAVGYCTMDGDTAGSISPIAGIDKEWLRTWLVWLEKTGCEVKGKHIKIEGLKYVNALQPTAELRPKDNKQTDEKDLMPYKVLNHIEQLGIRDKKSPLECFKNLEKFYENQYTREDLFNWTNRFFKLWSRNQWKRERYAPGFHLDSHNLDPKSWTRFPILSGGFVFELEKLKEYYEGKSGGGRKKIGF